MSEERKIVIWGTGGLSSVAEDILKQLKILDYTYIDSCYEKQIKLYKGKEVNAPEIITKNYFILISTAYFPEISAKLHTEGYRELEDYVSVLEPDYYEALLKNESAPRVPEITMNILNSLEHDLRENVTCENIDWFDEKEFAGYERDLGFDETYKANYHLIWEEKPYSRYRRKIMEYYFVDKLLDFDQWNKDDIYLDLGAQTSPFAKYLREKRDIKAYGIDLEKSIYADLGYYLQEDATNMHFSDESVSGMSIQSAYECFIGDADTRLIKEAARILKPKGKLIIIPLYMHEKYLSTLSPTYYGKGTADEGSFECIRTDCRGGLAIGRFYDIAALKERVLDVAVEQGLKSKIFILPNEIVENDAFVYLKFVLMLEK